MARAAKKAMAPEHVEPVLFGVYTREQAMGILDAQFDLIFRLSAPGNRGLVSRACRRR
jgi:hypothetical protein